MSPSQVKITAACKVVWALPGSVHGSLKYSISLLQISAALGLMQEKVNCHLQSRVNRAQRC